MHRRRSPLTAAQLDAGLTCLVETMAELHEVPMSDEAVARLELGRTRPVLWLDAGATAEDRCFALLDILAALVLGADAARDAQVVRRLRSVS